MNLWNERKNSKLLEERNIYFEDIVIAHPNPTKYHNQHFYIVEVYKYIYVVPFVEDEVKIFLKTIYPSRKLTKKYLKGEEQCSTINSTKKSKLSWMT